MTPQSNPDAVSTLPVLPMMPQFARWVVSGRKTSTLRSKVYPAGRYVIKIGGKDYAEVDVEGYSEPIYWPQRTIESRRNLAYLEGFGDVPEFEYALSKLQIHGNFWLRPFLAGTKPLYLHLLSNTTALQGAQNG